MSRWKEGLAISMLLALGACATVPLASQQADQVGKQFDPPAQGAGAIYVYRPGYMALAKKVDVAIAGGAQAQLASNTYFRLEGPPGPIDISCHADNTAGQEIAVQPGDVRYVEVAMNAGWLGPNCAVTEVSPQQGQAAIRNAKRVIPQ
jgi:hypothetical protein